MESSFIIFGYLGHCVVYLDFLDNQSEQSPQQGMKQTAVLCLGALFQDD